MTGSRKWLSYLYRPSGDGLRPPAVAILVAAGTVLGFFLWATWAVVLTRGTIAQWTHDVVVLIATIVGMLLLLVILAWIWHNRDDIRIRVRYLKLLRAGEADEPLWPSPLEISNERLKIMGFLYNNGWQSGVDLCLAGNWKARELEWLVRHLIDEGRLEADTTQAPGPPLVRPSRAQALIEFVDAVKLRYYSLTPKGYLYFEERWADASRQPWFYQNQINVLGNLNQIQTGTYQSEQQMWIYGHEEN